VGRFPAGLAGFSGGLSAKRAFLAQSRGKWAKNVHLEGTFCCIAENMRRFVAALARS
jgi:hypothetical protein